MPEAALSHGNHGSQLASSRRSLCQVQKPSYWCSITGMILALLSDVGIQMLQVVNVRLWPFWVQVLIRLACVAMIAIESRLRLQQIINLADIALLQWGSVVVKRLFRNVLQRRCALNLVPLLGSVRTMDLWRTHKELRLVALLWGQPSQICRH